MDAIPADRIAARSPNAGWGSSAGPRFVVATFDDAAPPQPVATLRSSAEVVFRAPHRGMVVEVYDRQGSGDEPAGVEDPAAARAGQGETDPTAPGPEAPDGADGRQSADAEGAAEPATPAQDPPPAPSVDSPGADAGPSRADGPGGTGDPDASVAGPPPGGTAGEASVAAGESFWSIAEDVVASELGVDAPEAAVAAYWTALVDANADRLVVPGNADLLHVGQTIVLPPLT